MACKRVFYSGTWWASIAALARAVGVSDEAIRHAVRKHGADLDAAGYHPRGATPGKGVVLDGVAYPSYGACARAAGASRTAIRRAVRLHGADLDAAGYHPRRIEDGRRVVLDGVVYPSCAAAARAVGVSEASIRYAARVHGADMDTHGDCDVRLACHVKYGGHHLSTARVLVTEYGVKAAAVLREISAHGGDLDRAGVRFSGDDLEWWAVDLPQRIRLQDLDGACDPAVDGDEEGESG